MAWHMSAIWATVVDSLYIENSPLTPDPGILSPCYSCHHHFPVVIYITLSRAHCSVPMLNVLSSVGHRTNIHMHSIFVGFCVCDGGIFCFIVVPKIQWIVTLVETFKSKRNWPSLSSVSS